MDRQRILPSFHFRNVLAAATTLVATLTVGGVLSFGMSARCDAQIRRAPGSCPRPAEGASVNNPPELRSHDGTLEVSLHLRYEQTTVSQGPPRYCFVTDEGMESPTLRVAPGDRLIIHLHNDLPPASTAQTNRHRLAASDEAADCAGNGMDASVTNLHFHGMSVPPLCHQDDVIHTAVQAGQSFDYRVTIPANEPPGLYWYHPHPHGFSERQIQGGASGALIVEGLQKRFPPLVTLDERILILRDQQRIGPEPPGTKVPTWDVSVNYVPIVYPQTIPAVILTTGKQEFWRVVNASADTIYDLEVEADHEAQPLRIFALDGVGLTSPETKSDLLLPPGARAEFVVAIPPMAEHAQLMTKSWFTGPAGDNDTARPLATLVRSSALRDNAESWKEPQTSPARSVSNASADKSAPVRRRLYFSQRSSNPQDPDNFVLYFITVEGQNPTPYKTGMPPNIVVHEGDQEEWTIENRSDEDHVFHIHQIHFRVLQVNGHPTSDTAMRDTIDVPYWNGKGPFPSVTLQMDFSDPNAVGTFLYHCHILKHEDMGMMGSIEVLPRNGL